MADSHINESILSGQRKTQIPKTTDQEPRALSTNKRVHGQLGSNMRLTEMGFCQGSYKTLGPLSGPVNGSNSHIGCTSENHSQTLHTTNLLMRSYVTDMLIAAKGPRCPQKIQEFQMNNIS